MTAEAGVVLTELRRAVVDATGGAFTFAPDPSSQSRATVGGAVGNDACGNHSVRHGRTADHVEELRLVTADGLRLTAGRTGLRATDPGDRAAVARAAHLGTGLRELASRHLAALRTELGRLPRQVSGYHLGHLLPENGFDVARALVGSEGTCAVVTGATLRIVPRATDTELVVVGYPDVVEAARDVPEILRHDPSAVEGIDEVIVATMRTRRGADSVSDLPDGHAWLFVELDVPPGGESPSDALRTALERTGRATDLRVVTDPGERADLWRVREDGAGLSSSLTDPQTGEVMNSWPGWEDSAVAPDRLADYLADFRELLAEHGLTGVMYGHFGAGCMHIRITFDLRSDAGRAVFRAFCTEAARLVVRHGGSLSGEHGDGRARSELLPIMYSAEMMGAFAEFVSEWDPAGILAPGGLRATAPLDDALALEGVPTRDFGELTAADGAHPVQACIGVGRCRSHSGGVMCPSFRATGDEKDSTRGRSRVLQEMIRGADTVSEGWSSTDVAESLEYCLACKACSSDCPTGVDMAAFKSEFLHHHHRGRRRPLAHYSLGLLPLWLRFTPHAAGLLNAVAGSALGRRGARLAGVTSSRRLPAFARSKDLRDELRRTPGHVTGGGTGRDAVDSEVVLFLDSFTRGLRPAVAGAAARVLGASHSTVRCEADVCCGLTHVTTGRLDAARRTLTRAARVLDTRRGPEGEEVPIVVVEPSCAATLRTELPRLVTADETDAGDAAAARRVAARIRSAATHLGELARSGRAPAWPSGEAPEAVTVQTHCHEYAGFGARVQRSALTALGVGSVREATGCCGVAGDFGFTAGHEEVAEAVARQALAPALREGVGGPGDTPEPVLTDGFSCATQVAHLADTEPGVGRRTGRHLVELLDPDPIRRTP